MNVIRKPRSNGIFALLLILACSVIMAENMEQRVSEIGRNRDLLPYIDPCTGAISRNHPTNSTEIRPCITGSPTETPSPTVSPTLNSVPTVNVAQTLSHRPTVAPVASSPATTQPQGIGNPIEGVCQDSVLRFHLGKTNENCLWVAEDRNTRCARGSVKTHCPKTCGLCDDDPNYCANSQMYFPVYLAYENKGYTWKQCNWVDRGNTAWKCAEKIGIKETCPQTCGFC